MRENGVKEEMCGKTRVSSLLNVINYCVGLNNPETFLIYLSDRIGSPFF
jgi:hypothetical protein